VITRVYRWYAGKRESKVKVSEPKVLASPYMKSKAKELSKRKWPVLEGWIVEWSRRRLKIFSKFTLSALLSQICSVVCAIRWGVKM